MDWSSKTMEVMEKIMFLTVLNILWLLGVAVGLGVFGLFPATLAVFKLISNRELFEKQSLIKPILKDFCRHYRIYFFQANSIGLVYVLILFSLEVDKNIIQLNEILTSVLLVPLHLFSIYAVMTLVFLIPIHIHTDGTTRQKIKLALLAPVLMPRASILILLLGIGLIILVDVFAAGIFLCYVSMTIVLLNKICLQAMYQKNVIIESKMEGTMA